MKAVENVAIIGAGNRFRNCTEECSEGFNVQMVDREAQYVARGRSIIEIFSRGIQRRIFLQDEVMPRLPELPMLLEQKIAAEDTDLVIEAVFEDFESRPRSFQP